MYFVIIYQRQEKNKHMFIHMIQKYNSQAIITLKVNFKTLKKLEPVTFFIFFPYFLLLKIILKEAYKRKYVPK